MKAWKVQCFKTLVRCPNEPWCFNWLKKPKDSVILNIIERQCLTYDWEMSKYRSKVFLELWLSLQSLFSKILIVVVCFACDDNWGMISLPLYNSQVFFCHIFLISSHLQIWVRGGMIYKVCIWKDNSRVILTTKNFSLGKKNNKQTSKGIIISFPPKIKNFRLLYEPSQN